MLILLVLFYIGLNYYERSKYRVATTTLNLTIGVYVAIVLINNLLMTRIGFYPVSDFSIFIIMAGMVFVFIGSLINYSKVASRQYIEYINKTENDFFDGADNIKIIHIMFIICITARFLQIRSGSVQSTDGDEQVLAGIPSHLFLMMYPFGAYIFYYAYSKKKILSFIIFGYGLVISFLSFVKYHVIFYILVAFIYCVIRNPKSLKKLLLITSPAIVVAFVLNYVISWSTVRTVTNNDIYIILRHMWKYIGGSIINGNAIETHNYIYPNYSPFDFLFSTFTPFLSMLTNRFFGFTMGESKHLLPFIQIGNYGGTSNVISTLHNVAATGSILFFCIFCIVWGMLISRFLAKIRTHQWKNLIFYCMFITISLMGFFANYFGLSAVWEILIWSYVLPRILLSKPIRINI